MLVNIILASILVSLIAFIGIVFLLFQKVLLDKILSLLAALAAGVLMGQVFYHLLPEAVSEFPADKVFSLTVLSFVIFFFLEKVFYWRHCHDTGCLEHPFGYLNLIGDGFHNFLDGMIIAAAFWENVSLGWTTTLAVILHEIPQEIGDFGVLLLAGFSPRKALIANFLTAILALLGAVTGYFLINKITGLEGILLPFAAGGFLYIAAVDLLPEIRTKAPHSWQILLTFLLGLIVMAVI
ncbi:MAG: ZIP family metal transporter [Candidatus Shapirobacteria bacterium]|nr:ZIP family metal transporter [Candidatus Shapirobacteria bacterium]